MKPLTKEQIAANPDSVITAPRDTLDKITIYAMPEGICLAAKKVITCNKSTFIVLGADNILYAQTVHRWVNYRDALDSHWFSDSVLRALRTAKVITTKAIMEHRHRSAQRSAEWKHARRVRSFNDAASALGIKPTRQQLRDIAKLAPKEGSAR